MKLKHNLYSDLILRYLLFLVASVLATGFFLGGLAVVSLNTIAEYPEAAGDLTLPYRDIVYDGAAGSLTLPRALGEGEWVKVLEGNQVVYRGGALTDGKSAYTQEELALIISNAGDLLPGEAYLYDYMPFEGADGSSYALLYARPKVENPAFKVDFGVPSALEGSAFAKTLQTRVLWASGLFLAVLAVLILLFGRMTTQKMIRPLKALNYGFGQVVKGDYSVRLDFKGNREFEEMREAFNVMTERLQRAERDNKAMAESKKRLLLDISHDLRTPATTLQGYAEALRDGLVEDPEKRLRYLGYIHEKSKALVGLIDRLFLYTKLDGSIYELDRQVRDFPEFLRRALIGFFGELEEKGFLVDIEIPEERIPYLFDAVEMERALSNLVGNVIKYNEPGTTLSVSLSQGEGRLRLRVGDDGCGIPETLKDRLFNAMVRGEGVRRTHEGTGLGLAITKKIVELHGGVIKVESTAGKGCVFVIDLPQ